MNQSKSKLLRKSAAKFATQFNLSPKDFKKHYRQLKKSYIKISRNKKQEFIKELV